MDFLKDIPVYQRVMLLILLLVFIIGIFIYFVYIPVNAEIRAENTRIADLNSDILIHRKKAARLEELERENTRLQKLLLIQKRQLPQEEEVASLLKQVSDIGISTGLDFRLWKPAGRKDGDNGLYVEIPVNVEVSGGYHSVGFFFDKIGKLPRIVNISNIRMGNIKIKENQVHIHTTFIATTFASLRAEKGI
ncbi:MAG: type 4a pilus biogenesis protein PilO [Nitrospirota bacterium]